MTRLVPFPIVSAALAFTWLALNGASAAHGVLAVILALVIPLAAAPFLSSLPAVRAPGKALVLLAIVTWDIMVANAAVARLVLGPMGRLRPAFVEVPLEITHPHAIALLASIVTMTPGTVSLGLSPDARTLLVHALDVDDPVALVANIKARYETPIKEILEC